MVRTETDLHINSRLGCEKPWVCHVSSGPERFPDFPASNLPFASPREAGPERGSLMPLWSNAELVPGPAYWPRGTKGGVVFVREPARCRVPPLPKTHAKEGLCSSPESLTRTVLAWRGEGEGEGDDEFYLVTASPTVAPRRHQKILSISSSTTVNTKRSLSLSTAKAE